MAVDVEVDYARADQLAAEEGADPDDVRLVFLDGLMRHIEEAATNALRETGQKLKLAEADLEFTTVDVRFSGDHDGAVAALERWTDAVADLVATRRILRARLRGSDGTDLSYWNEEHRSELEKLRGSLDDETKGKIDGLLDEDEQ
jgi:hypothetical protein